MKLEEAKGPYCQISLKTMGNHEKFLCRIVAQCPRKINLSYGRGMVLGGNSLLLMWPLAMSVLEKLTMFIVVRY